MALEITCRVSNLRSLVVAGLLLGTLGCGPGGNLGNVSGKVTYNGEPFSGARVTFQPVAGGKAAVGHVDASGNYYARYSPNSKGAAIGAQKVSVTRMPVPGEAPKPIPGEYSDMDFTVEPGSNTLDIEIKTE